MQLKRDTDYAIRILLVMAEPVPDKELQGLKIKTICEKTDIPRQIALRLCNLLSGLGFIKKEGEGESATYTPESNLPEKTVLDIIKAVEGQSNLFAVFDRRTEMYERYGHLLESVNEILLRELNNVTIQTILGREQSKHNLSHSEFLDESEKRQITS